MEKDFNNIKNGQSGFGLVILGMLGLLFRPLLDVWKLFKKEIIQNILDKKWKDFGFAIIPIILIFFFLIYSFNGLYKDIRKIIFYERYERLIVENYKKDIEDFFKKYEERFLAHDCGFMQEVGTDEAMYDKYGKTSYDKDYKCETFYKIQELKMLPLKIGEIEKAGNKLKVKGELIRVEMTNGQPIKIAPIRFELWKTIDMDLWHFNLYGEPKDRWIESEFKNY